MNEKRKKIVMLKPTKQMTFNKRSDVCASSFDWLDLEN